MQNVDIYPRCLARAAVDDKFVYYIVVESERMNQFRKVIKEIVAQQDEDLAKKIDPRPYLHVTIAYNAHDLFTSTHHIYKHGFTCVKGFTFE